MLTTFKKDIKKYEHNAELLKTLAHPVRLCIVKHLIQVGSSNVSDLYAGLKMPQSTVSQHLSKLKSARIVTGDRKGLEIYYSVQNETVVNVMRDLA